VRYFVFAPDGTRFGPADIPTLNQWVLEGRLLPEHWLEDETTRVRLQAGQVPGIVFMVRRPEVSAGEAPPQVYQAVYGRPEYAGYDDGSGDIRMAWMYIALGLLCCTPFIIGAFRACRRAQNKGNPKAASTRTAVWALLFVSLLLNIWGFRALSEAFSGGLAGSFKDYP